MKELIKKLIASKWASRKLAVVLAALSPAILRATGVEVSEDFWLQLAELVVGGLASVAYLLSQGKVDSTEVQSAGTLKAMKLKAVDNLTQAMNNGPKDQREKANDALLSLLKSA